MHLGSIVFGVAATSLSERDGNAKSLPDFLGSISVDAVPKEL